MPTWLKLLQKAVNAYSGWYALWGMVMSDGAIYWLMRYSQIYPWYIDVCVVGFTVALAFLLGVAIQERYSAYKFKKAVSRAYQEKDREGLLEAVRDVRGRMFKLEKNGTPGKVSKVRLSVNLGSQMDNSHKYYLSWPLSEGVPPSVQAAWGNQ